MYESVVYAIGGYLFILYGITVWMGYFGYRVRLLWWFPWWLLAVGVGELWRFYRPTDGRVRARLVSWGGSTLALLLVLLTGAGWSRYGH